MAAILQTTFAIYFLERKVLYFDSNFTGVVQLSISQYWLR